MLGPGGREAREDAPAFGPRLAWSALRMYGRTDVQTRPATALPATLSVAVLARSLDEPASPV